MEAVAEITAAVKNVPALRFPEFEGEWKSVRLGTISETITSGSRDWAQFYSDSGDKFIRMTNLPKIGIRLLLDDLRFVSLPENSSEGKRTSLEYGDILISITAELGKIGWVPEDLGVAYINQHVALVRLKNEIYSQFIAHQLSTVKSNVRLNRLNDSGAKAGLNLSSIKSVSLSKPSFLEQQKIASFLSVTDQKTQQLSKKKALLERYKKGVMQQIFSQQIRFKDDNGNAYPEWKRKKLKEILTEGRLGGNYDNSETNEGIPLIKMGNLGRGNINLEKVQYLPSEEVYNEEDVLIEGDLLFNTRNTLELVGKVAIWRNEIPFALYNSNLMRLKFNSEIEPSNRFMNYFFNIDSSIKQLRAYATGTTSVAAIYGRDLRNFRVTFPCLEEQIKIADFLTSIDNKLSYTSKELEQAQQFKKGLLQQLFV